MRYGILSDIHGNLEALQAVLKALSGDGIDRYLCLGDVVGYGADPKACIKLVKTLEPEVMIAGNHEWGVLGLFGLEYFHPLAQSAVVWARGALDASETEYLKSFRLTCELDDCTLVHGTLIEPEKFYYMRN